VSLPTSIHFAVLNRKLIMNLPFSDPKFPNDCEKATRSLGGGYCGDETFGVRDC
jgi:hypothetical protein